MGDRHGTASSLNNLGNLLHHQGDDETAEVLYEEGLALFRLLDDQHGIATLIDQIGVLSYLRGDLARARALFAESLALRRQVGDQQGIAAALNNLGNVLNDQGDTEAARACYAESLTLLRFLGDQWCITYSLESLASLAHGLSHMSRSAHLLGAAFSLRESLGSPLPPSEQEIIDRQTASARAALGEITFSQAWTAGRDMTLEQAMDYALQDTPSSHLTASVPLDR